MVFIKGENKFTSLKLIIPGTFQFFPISKTGLSFGSEETLDQKTTVSFQNPTY